MYEQRSPALAGRIAVWAAGVDPTFWRPYGQARRRLVLIYNKLQRRRAQAVRDLVLRIRTIRPQVMLTFGPDGGLTGHVDHAMAGAFATLAFEWAGRTDRYPEQLEQGLKPHRVQKLYYLTADYVLADRHPISPPTVTAHIEIGNERFEKKTQAFQQHQTQKPLFERVRKNLGQSHPAVEMYHLAATSRPREGKSETDLFEDVLEDDPS